jgi:hypothetical protein
MTTTIQQQMSHLQADIFLENYYVDLYHAVLRTNKMCDQGIQYGIYSDESIVDMCNDFWEALPDSMSIRRHPFYLLCDLCETETSAGDCEAGHIAEHCFEGEE